MKMDMDLIRKILLALEEHEHGYATMSLEIDGYTEEEIGYHVWLMGEDQARLLKVEDVSSEDMEESPYARPICIRWDGYEFLEAAREPSRWRTAVEKVKSTGTGMTIEILKGVLLAISREKLGL